MMLKRSIPMTFSRFLAALTVQRMRLLIVLFALPLANCAAPQALPERPDIPFGEGRLWLAERPGQPPSYFFGTIHVTDPRVFDLPAPVETAFANAQLAVFEVDYRRRASLKELQQYFNLPEGQKLEDLIGYQAHRDLVELMRTHQIPFYNYYRRQPWVAWMTIADREITVDEQEDSERLVLDDWLLVRARKARKEVAFLETGKEQWQAFAGIPMNYQVTMLRAAIDEFYSPRTKVERVRLYLDGDLALRVALWQRSLSYLEAEVAKTFNDRLIVDRNHRMVERMLPLMAEASAFVAVGALHMPGEEGILRLLEQQGFTLTRLH